MRAESGKPLERPLGSPVVLSPGEAAVQSRSPVPSSHPRRGADCDGGDDRPEGPEALDAGDPGVDFRNVLRRRPRIEGQDRPGPRRLPGRDGHQFGEAPLIEEERKEAKFFIGQYNRGGWMNTDEQLKRLDAIEIQLGQGAQAAAPMGTVPGRSMKPSGNGSTWPRGKTPDPHPPAGDEPGGGFSAAGPGASGALRRPGGLKTCATHYLERD